MVEYAYEFGKRWKVEVPRNSVKWLVDRTHVSTPFEDIKRDLLNRMEGREGFTATIMRQTIEYAYIVHTRNRELYMKVVRG